VGHACKVGLGLRGPQGASGWLRRAVERVRGRQVRCLAGAGRAAASSTWGWQKLCLIKISSFSLQMLQDKEEEGCYSNISTRGW
jgi:hypothetical protein